MLIGYGVVTVVFIAALFKTEQNWRLQYLKVAYLAYSAYVFGINVELLTTTITALTQMIP